MVALNARTHRDDGAALLADADRAGLLLWIEPDGAGGKRIEIRGPRSAEPIVRRLAAACSSPKGRAAVLAALADRDRPAAPGRRRRWGRPPTPWCPYGHPAGWVSVFGPPSFPQTPICATCHPPARPAIVARRVGDAR